MKTSTLFLFASWALVVGCSGSGSSGGIAGPNQPGGSGNPSPSPTTTATTDPPNPGGGGNVVIHIHANTKPFAHADSYAGQTPRDEYLGIRALVLGTSKDDPNPLVVFDHAATPLQGGATFVEARLNDGDDTVVATVPASKLRAGAYTWARTYVTHARYKVDATVHASGFATPGEYEDLVVLTDGTEVQGKKRQSGDLEATFRGGGQTYGPTEATMPIAGWAAGPFSFELAGGTRARQEDGRRVAGRGPRLIVYLDASALVKRYVAEAGSADVSALIDAALSAGTAIVSRAEVTAALARAARMKIVTRADAAAALEAFDADWESLVRLQLGEPLMARAARLAWQQGLRGYDATHLAAAHFWQDVMGEAVTLATYDRQLWDAAKATGLAAWPAQPGG